MTFNEIRISNRPLGVGYNVIDLMVASRLVKQVQEQYRRQVTEGICRPVYIKLREKI